MNYYYDVTLNFKKDHLYKFYEWQLEDELLEVKKIPIYRLSGSSFINICRYDGKVEEDFLKKIKNRTIYKDRGKIKTIIYATIFTDTRFSIAVIFDKDGNIIGRSNLLLEDDLNIIELGYSLKKEKIMFHKEKQFQISFELRQEEQMKQIIRNDLDKSYKDNNSKLIYYYLEWFHEYNSNIKEIYLIMLKELDKQDTKKLDQIYNLVLLTT